jgi:hypothetical protein
MQKKIQKMKKIKRRSSYLFTIIIVTLFISSCGGSCGDSFDKNPEYLLKEYETAFECKLVESDTLLHLGETTYLNLNEKASLFIIEYKFNIINTIKSKKKYSQLSLLNLEIAWDDYSTIMKFQKNKTQLIFGNSISNYNDLVHIMKANAPEEWQSNSFSRNIINSNELRKIVDENNVNKHVIYCAEPEFTTIRHFSKGKLCYYDDDNNAIKVSSAEYLRKIISIANKSVK